MAATRNNSVQSFPFSLTNTLLYASNYPGTIQDGGVCLRGIQTWGPPQIWQINTVGDLRYICFLIQDKSFLGSINIEERGWMFKNQSKRGQKEEHLREYLKQKINLTLQGLLNFSHWRRSLLHLLYMDQRNLHTSLNIQDHSPRFPFSSCLSHFF